MPANKMKTKDQIALGVPIFIASASLIGGVFAWAFTQFGAINGKIATDEVSITAVSGKVDVVSQKTDDVDIRLTRIENKIDQLTEYFNPKAK